MPFTNLIFCLQFLVLNCNPNSYNTKSKSTMCYLHEKKNTIISRQSSAVTIWAIYVYIRSGVVCRRTLRTYM